MALVACTSLSGVAEAAVRPLCAQALFHPTPWCREGRRAAALRKAGRPAAAPRGITCSASVDASPAVSNGVTTDAGAVPQPVVKIDNQHDPFATIVTVEFGDRLGELLDTIAALKSLKLNIRRARIKPAADGTHQHKFFITDATTSEKILKSARVEEIRLTILNNLLQYHPEAGSNMAWGAYARKESSRDLLSPLGEKNRHVVETVIDVREDEDASHSEVFIQTRDRPGLLTDIVHTLKDINVNVVSAEVDTEGVVAKDCLYVTYHGEPLGPSMTQLVTNALQYYLSLADVEKEESY